MSRASDSKALKKKFQRIPQVRDCGQNIYDKGSLTHNKMADDDSDPIKASYDIFIKPAISADRQVYVLQYPNRDSMQYYTESNNARPSTMRL